MSNMERKRTSKIIKSDTRKIVYNVIKYFEMEKNLGCYQPLSLSNMRCAMATGLSKNTITRIKKEGKQAEQKNVELKAPKKGLRGKCNTRVPVSSFQLTALRRIVASIYEIHKEVPSIRKIHATAKSDLNFNGSKTTVRNILIKQLGFEFKKCRQNRSLLLEKSHLIAWRVKYLRKIRENDALGPQKRPVVYLDEMWIHSKCLQTHMEQNVKKHTHGHRWMIVHAGSEAGFVKGACLIFKTISKNSEYLERMDEKKFFKYINEILISNLPPKSIIVMDNAPYHNMELDKAPTIASPKAEIKLWLFKNNIDFHEDWTKAELLQEVSKKEKSYAVDNILAEHGHEVLRLPPFNGDLNPAEYVWNLIKQKVAKENVEAEESRIESLTLEAIGSITAADWTKGINHVKRLEQEYWERDVGKEHILEEFIIKLGLQNDSENDDDDDKVESSESEDSESMEDSEEAYIQVSV